jgi:ABC-2 type transport system ATP-binding protein
LSEPRIRVAGLGVRYGERWALRDVSFEVAAGEVVALLGPNGAGKTTLLSVLAGLFAPQEGGVEVGGFDVVGARARAQRVAGLVPQRLALYPSLTARENLLFFAGAAGLGRRAARAAAERTLAVAGLAERAAEPVAAFSGGMRRRLNLACGMLSEPRVLLLDEPTVGVDPQSRERIFEAVRAQAATGVAVLWSTHQIEEAERLCDRVVLVDHGRLVAEGTPGELVQRFGAGLRLEIVTPEPLPPGWERGAPGASPCEPSAHERARARGALACVRLETIAAAPLLLERAVALGQEVLEVEVHRSDLEDVFIALTGRELRD